MLMCLFVVEFVIPHFAYFHLGLVESMYVSWVI
jgi:hypothetical protein